MGRGLPGALAVKSQTQMGGHTSFVVSVPKSSRVSLKLFNPKSGAATILVNQFLNAGYYRMEYPGSFHHNGIFIYQIIAGTEMKTGKLFVLRGP